MGTYKVAREPFVKFKSLYELVFVIIYYKSSSNKHLISTCYILNTVLGAGETGEYKGV